MNQLAIISGFLGGTKNRYITYQPERGLAERLEMAGRAEGFSGVELCYPQDFDDPVLLRSILARHGLGVSAVNFRSRRTGMWMRGSFTSEIKAERDAVVEDLCRAMDLAAEFGAHRITTCPLNEGHDHLFEMDYAHAYGYMEETIGRAAAYRRDVRICIEYKWNDPRARCLLGNAGETLAFCQSLGAPNVGVTLDFGHAIQAGERPAQSAVLLARADKLFYVHINDNDKIWDWDMIPGAYNLLDMVEFFYTLRQLGYEDWFGYDVFPKEHDTVDVFAASAEMTRRIQALADRLEAPEIDRLRALRNPAQSMRYVYDRLFPAGS